MSILRRDSRLRSAGRAGFPADRIVACVGHIACYGLGASCRCRSVSEVINSISPMDKFKVNTLILSKKKFNSRSVESIISWSLA